MMESKASLKNLSQNGQRKSANSPTVTLACLLPLMGKWPMLTLTFPLGLGGCEGQGLVCALVVATVLGVDGLRPFTLIIPPLVKIAKEIKNEPTRIDACTVEKGRN